MQGSKITKDSNINHNDFVLTKIGLLLTKENLKKFILTIFVLLMFLF